MSIFLFDGKNLKEVSFLTFLFNHNEYLIKSKHFELIKINKKRRIKISILGVYKTI